MSAQVMCRFFWGKFLPWMMARKYKENVYASQNIDESQEACEEYLCRVLGLLRQC